MKRLGLDGLVVYNNKGRENYDAYLSNEQFHGAVVMPLDVDPIGITALTQRLARRLTSSLLDSQSWLRDLRVGLNGPQSAVILNELGLAKSRIGVVGLDSWGPGEFEGLVPYPSFRLMATLPSLVR